MLSVETKVKDARMKLREILRKTLAIDRLCQLVLEKVGDESILTPEQKQQVFTELLTLKSELAILVSELPGE